MWHSHRFPSVQPKEIAMTLSEQVREAIRECGMTVYQLAFVVKVEETSLRRFLNGETGLSQAAIDRIGEALKLKLTRGGDEPR